jgi:hypothetical protein
MAKSKRHSKTKKSAGAKRNARATVSGPAQPDVSSASRDDLAAKVANAGDAVRPAVRAGASWIGAALLAVHSRASDGCRCKGHAERPIDSPDVRYFSQYSHDIPLRPPQRKWFTHEILRPRHT